VAASLLTAIGLPELIVSTLDEYEELAVQLATHPLRLSDIRRRLAAQRARAPLFDTRRYARDLETAFTEMYERHQADLPPEDIVVGDRGAIESAESDAGPISHHG
jgi:protein O-GlcNAc transferase